MGGAMLSKSLIQFSVDGWSCVPSLLFTWGQTMVEVMKIMVTSLKRSQACTATAHDPNPTTCHHWPMPLLETPRHPQASLLWRHCSFLLGPGAQGSVVPSKSPVHTLVLSATPALNYFYKIPSSSPGLGHIVFKGRSPLYPPLTGKAIKLLFSTSPQTLSLRLELAAVKRGRDFSISCDCDSVKLIFSPF